MSLFAEYLSERTADLIIEGTDGFVTYRYVDEKTVYIVEIYTRSKMRRSGYATTLADQVVDEARAKGCTEAIGTVVPSTKGATTSLKVLLGYGMELKSSGPDLIIFRKGI